MPARQLACNDALTWGMQRSCRPHMQSLQQTRPLPGLLSHGPLNAIMYIYNAEHCPVSVPINPGLPLILSLHCPVSALIIAARYPNPTPTLAPELRAAFYFQSSAFHTPNISAETVKLRATAGDRNCGWCELLVLTLFVSRE